ncbi:hypothetical protein V6N13_079102 [Hibiscus sabdariffa]|uniref:Protein kinase domain-containing protein n=1 Tax=Hibiscus sabdariffa TaxID=183260 RepID=A0ABR2RQX0_9ROSI
MSKIYGKILDTTMFAYSHTKRQGWLQRNSSQAILSAKGGFGVVYKGIIDDNVRPGFPSTAVAVKQLNPDGFQGDKEWLAEVNYLGQFSHPNLVKLIGYCCEDDHRLLVYEHMSSGCLEKHLFRRSGCGLTWSKRMKIALGAAKGLAFLHGAERPVIYRDFKSSNILLDEDFNAKLSDFGLAKYGPMGDQTHVSTRVMGTIGYAAPEYILTGHLTARSDVYGFGVVLLEMLLGRRVLDKGIGRGQNLVEWARPLLNNNKKLIKILDPKMEGQYLPRAAMRVAKLAYLCLNENPKGRPLMSQVVECLEKFQTKDVNHEEAMLQKGACHNSMGAYKEMKDKEEAKAKPPKEPKLFEPLSSKAEDKVGNVARVFKKRVIQGSIKFGLRLENCHCHLKFVQASQGNKTAHDGWFSNVV